MRQYTLVFSVLGCMLMAGCGGSSSDNGTGPTNTATGSVRGSISVVPGVATSGSVTGNVVVVVGDSVLTLPVNQTVPAGGSLNVSYLFSGIDAGRATMFYLATLNVGGQVVMIGGYEIVEVVEGDTVTVDSTEYTPITASSDYTASGAVHITSFTAAATHTTIANLVVQGSLTNMDLDHVFIYVNGNSFPVSVSPASDGTCSFTTVVTLDPGANTIELVAMNSRGSVVVSSPLTVTYTATVSGNMMLGTLIWDDSTDMDLHLWYYKSTSPDLTSMPFEHCAYWHKDLDSIAPNGIDSAGNLDVDNVTAYGPEHMTLINYPDGYYVFAIDAYNLYSEDHALCTFTLSVGGQQRTMSHNFTVSNDESYTTNMDAWMRCFDVKVVGGVATILTPNPAFVYQDQAAFSKALNKVKKHK